MLVFWSDQVKVLQLVKTEFCIEMEVVCDSSRGACWQVFVYMSTNEGIQKHRWEFLKMKKSDWGKR